jgi:hypothetical protein
LVINTPSPRKVTPDVEDAATGRMLQAAVRFSRRTSTTPGRCRACGQAGDADQLRGVRASRRMRNSSFKGAGMSALNSRLARIERATDRAMNDGNCVLCWGSPIAHLLEMHEPSEGARLIGAETGATQCSSN